MQNPKKNLTENVAHGYSYNSTGELGYDGLSGTRKIGLSYAKSVVYILRILDMHRTQGPSISSVICKNLSYSGPSYPSSPVLSKRYPINTRMTGFSILVTLFYC